MSADRYNDDRLNPCQGRSKKLLLLLEATLFWSLVWFLFTLHTADVIQTQSWCCWSSLGNWQLSRVICCPKDPLVWCVETHVGTGTVTCWCEEGFSESVELISLNKWFQSNNWLAGSTPRLKPDNLHLPLCCHHHRARTMLMKEYRICMPLTVEEVSFLCFPDSALCAWFSTILSQMCDRVAGQQILIDLLWNQLLESCQWCDYRFPPKDILYWDPASKVRPGSHRLVELLLLSLL